MRFGTEKMRQELVCVDSEMYSQTVSSGTDHMPVITAVLSESLKIKGTQFFNPAPLHTERFFFLDDVMYDN